MGSTRLGTLPRTRRWQEVIDLLRNGADTPQIAVATIHAAEQGLRRAASDFGVLETVWLLMRLPGAAREVDFPAALQRCGVSLQHEPNLMELLGAFADAVDACLDNNCGRTDLGEMAQMAAVETLAWVVGTPAVSLFESRARDVLQTLAGLFSARRFGALAAPFFARLIFKCMDYFLSRVLSDHVGQGRRFVTIQQQATFCDALETHCRETSAYLEAFAGDWVAKERRATGAVPRSLVPNFVGGAMSKAIDALKEGRNAHGQ